MYHDHIDHRLDIYTSDLTSCHETTFGAKLRSFLKRTNRTRRFAKKYVARSEESVQICMHLVLSMDHGCTTLMMKTLSTLIIYIICCIRILDAQYIKGPWFWYTPKYAYMYIYIFLCSQLFWYNLSGLFQQKWTHMARQNCFLTSTRWTSQLQWLVPNIGAIAR